MVYAWPRYQNSSELPDIGRRTWYRARDHPDELNIDYLVIYFNTNKAAILPRSEGGVLHRKIIGSYHQDERLDWVADLECGHGQHVRHNPPWVVSPTGRLHARRAGDVAGRRVGLQAVRRGEREGGRHGRVTCMGARRGGFVTGNRGPPGTNPGMAEAWCDCGLGAGVGGPAADAGCWMLQTSLLSWQPTGSAAAPMRFLASRVVSVSLDRFSLRVFFFFMAILHVRWGWRYCRIRWNASEAGPPSPHPKKEKTAKKYEQRSGPAGHPRMAGAARPAATGRS